MLRSHRVCIAFLWAALATGTLSACQSTPMSSLSHVHKGMIKSSVLAEAGSPTVTRRLNGEDCWIYEYRDHNDQLTVTEVHFDGGEVVYVGPHRMPTMSAEERDRRNEKSNAEEDIREEQEMRARDKRLGITRSKDMNEDATDRKLRESMYGIEPDPRAEQNTLAPVFEPVR